MKWLELVKELLGNVLIFATGALMLQIFIGFWIYGEVTIREGNLFWRAFETLLAAGVIVLAIERMVKDINRWFKYQNRRKTNAL